MLYQSHAHDRRKTGTFLNHISLAQVIQGRVLQRNSSVQHKQQSRAPALQPLTSVQTTGDVSVPPTKDSSAADLHELAGVACGR